MPAPFKRLSVPEFALLLERFPFSRHVTSVHMHHTWRPNHAQFRGHDSIVSMWRFHTKERGFSDIAQHLTIDPEGFVWTGRNWNARPASANGFNGNSARGPFMFEIIGDFDQFKKDILELGGSEDAKGDAATLHAGMSKLVAERKLHVTYETATRPNLGAALARQDGDEKTDPSAGDATTDPTEPGAE